MSSLAWYQPVFTFRSVVSRFGCKTVYHFISVLTSISEAEETELSLDGLSKSLLAGLVSGDRASLARSITLVESTHPVKAAQARKLVTHATRHYRNNGLQSFRLGLSGPPGTRKRNT